VYSWHVKAEGTSRSSWGVLSLSRGKGIVVRVLVIGLVSVALLAAACSSPEVDPAAQPAVTDLAARLGVDESEIAVVSVEEVTWSDGSIGCPEPGMMYTQALVNGSLVILEVDGTRYEYHSGGGRDLFYCENPIPPTGGDL